MAEGSLRQWKKKPRVISSFTFGTFDGAFLYSNLTISLEHGGVMGVVLN
jgi:hypothetical protein